MIEPSSIEGAAQRGRNAIDNYIRETGADKETALRDLLCDLRHMAAQDDIESFDDQLEEANTDYMYEVADAKAAAELERQS